MNKREFTTGAAAGGSAPRSYQWPLLLGGIFSAFLLFSFWSIYQAGERVSPVLDPDYYRSGQAYHLDDRAWRAAAAAGWQILLAREGDLIQARLVDGRGLPVAGGLVTLRGSRRQNNGATPWQVELLEEAPGIYRAQVATLPANSADLIIAARTAEAGLERRLRVNAGSWSEAAL